MVPRCRSDRRTVSRLPSRALTPALWARDSTLIDSADMPNDPQTPAGHSKPAFDPYARPALPNIPPPDDTGGPGRAMWCSDCRAPLRPHYYAMNTRPVCAKCKGGYEAQIARGTGSAAFVRAVVWGGGAALGGALVLAAILLSIGAVFIADWCQPW